MSTLIKFTNFTEKVKKSKKRIEDIVSNTKNKFKQSKKNPLRFNTSMTPEIKSSSQESQRTPEIKSSSQNKILYHDTKQSKPFRSIIPDEEFEKMPFSQMEMVTKVNLNFLIPILESDLTYCFQSELIPLLRLFRKENPERNTMKKEVNPIFNFL
jgi:hypothetical protein